MGTIAWLLLGGIAGWIASLIMKTDGSQGIILNIVVGIIGAWLGGFLFNALGGAGVTGLNFYSLLVSVVGAVALIWVVKMIKG
jgi:uncharacterized membrane protein YeaQ/YmgE (transglycosylase-associated protein family)